ncbi:MAG: undecaprenyldiphospho-muramoylpentapeptide beta-N-acetylglucosaminyltransferase [Candidatus Moranbacteria bacterium]|jgi:UDP-N-acetylglucosamine--N-acetylmuramyl-(pentapeptide) pyrophosphoryl-undecaprenol N-acetylglucosamine transferase|nr:undecaprenyldiphospho-muramoylpentapeptide beta-N-acetylglucosaminyltransferase [Candidatus Moranbacteria bacterium]
MSLPRVVLSGGISGGHTFPLIAVARALRERYPRGIEFLFIGSQGQFESQSMADEGIPAQYVLTGKMRRYFSWKNFIDPFKVPIGILQALWKLFLYMPDVVFSKGGSAAVPVVIAAWIYQIPVVIHDSDAVAGRANRFLARFATRIAIAYPSAHTYFPRGKTALTGNPVREEILAGDAARAQAVYGLSPSKPTLAIFGGSQGAMVLNEATLHILPELIRQGVQIIHQTGKDNYALIIQVLQENGIEPEKNGYIVKDFFSVTELADVLAVATVVLSRAGANSIAELAATKKAVILVPLKNAANDEQRMNAYDIAALGGALVLEEPNLGEHILSQKIFELIDNPELRALMGEKIHAFYHPQAATDIATGIASIIDR